MQHVQEGLLINLHSNSTNEENETLHCKGKYLSYSNERNDNHHIPIKHLFNYFTIQNTVKFSEMITNNL